MRIARSIVFLCVIGSTVAIPLFLKTRITDGQRQNFPQPNRRPACTCFCGDGTFHSFNLFPAGAQKAGKCYGGPLPSAVCGDTMANLPAGSVQQLCQNAKPRDLKCPVLKRLCQADAPPSGKGCNSPSTPWFGGGTADCKDVQAPVVAVNRGAVTVSVCGYPVFRGVDPTPGVGDPNVFLTAYLTVMKSHVENTVGSKVCCDSLRAAARTGNPCDAAADIDCDGKPNSTDVVVDSVSFPDINLFTKQGNAPIDEFPPGLNPDDPNFLPETTARDSKGVGDCSCKWELIKGTLTCSPDGTKDHVYAATWQCPANGKEVFTTKYAKAAAPCKANKKTAGVNIFLDYFDQLSRSSTSYVPVTLRSAGCG